LSLFIYSCKGIAGPTGKSQHPYAPAPGSFVLWRSKKPAPCSERRLAVHQGDERPINPSVRGRPYRREEKTPLFGSKIFAKNLCSHAWWFRQASLLARGKFPYAKDSALHEEKELMMVSGGKLWGRVRGLKRGDLFHYRGKGLFGRG